jgi:demethylspheroidene O-methyltransferase
MFDLIAGFCQSQVLLALVKLDVLDQLADQSMTVQTLSRNCHVPVDRMLVLLNAAASLKLLRKRGELFSLTSRGAALITVPGLKGMIAHHDVLYRDLSDPVAFFRGEVETELADFWPYVFGAGQATDPGIARRYSELMADSQGLVAEDTLQAISLKGVNTLLDVGGGTGAFLAAAAGHSPDLKLMLFDLPAVLPDANVRFAALGITDRVTTLAGSFRDQALPAGADAISLVRVLYDHEDETVLALLSAIKTALPNGGRLIISEPMTGGPKPQIAGDAYFALYCMAMRTGRARSAQEITALLTRAGFSNLVIHRSKRPYITSVIEAVNVD